jgi:glycosyltransferase involved in cell wall biosynthesis
MNTSYHIAHLHTSPAWGGGEYQVLHLLEGLFRRQVDATLFCHPWGKLFMRADERGLPVRGIPSAAFFPVLPLCLSSLARSMSDVGVNLIHAHDSLATTIGIRVARRLKVPLVLSRRIASPMRRNPLSCRKYSQRNITAVIAISDTVKDVFGRTANFPMDRIFVAPSGIDVKALSDIESDKEFRQGMGGAYIVVGIGKLSAKKNWQFMVRVAAELAKTGVDIHWCLAGDGPERGRLQRLVNDLGISSRFHLLGFRTDATNILKNADLLFFPSLMEGASVTVRTAMVLGTPVVAVDAPGTMESLAGHGWVIKPDDVAGAAQSVVQALTDKAKRDAVCNAARESAISRFSFEKTIDSTIAVYERVLALHT